MAVKKRVIFDEEMMKELNAIKKILAAETGKSSSEAKIIQWALHRLFLRLSKGAKGKQFV